MKRRASRIHFAMFPGYTICGARPPIGRGRYTQNERRATCPACRRWLINNQPTKDGR